MSSVAQLQFQDTKEQRQHRCEADQEQKHQKWAAIVMPTWQVTNWELIAATRVLECIRIFESSAGSDLFQPDGEPIHLPVPPFWDESRETT